MQAEEKTALRSAFDRSDAYERLGGIIRQLSSVPAVDAVVSDRVTEAAVALEEARRRLRDISR